MTVITRAAKNKCHGPHNSIAQCYECSYKNNSPYHNFSSSYVKNVLLGTDLWAKSVNKGPNLVW